MELDLPEHGKSSPLPPYRGVLAVDMENFSRTSARNQQVIGALIPDVLEKALTRSDLEQVWKEKRFARHGGDGYVFGTEPEYLPFLISPFLENLQKELEEIQPILANLDRELRMRLRVSVDVGPLPDLGDSNPVSAMGEAMISTHRLLDSAPVRDELKRTDPDTTLVAVIVSRRVYEDVVLGGFTPVRPARWRQVNATVGNKDFRAEGYLFVPTPSWSSKAQEIAEVQDETGSGSATPEDGSGDTSSVPIRARAHTANSVGANYRGQVVQGGTIHGGVNFGVTSDDR
ncbi:hypothetical protein [Nocardiopsis ganjiahuensis]|uniref:hypothetical protein n=1 Tax=Nocardiopsis ganjiahuensis TaxID=239984 RepID=UPI000346F56A|nr:hypothetical protein [Nocardiopsis ganjiahuensis]